MLVDSNSGGARLRKARLKLPTVEQSGMSRETTLDRPNSLPFWLHAMKPKEKAETGAL